MFALDSLDKLTHRELMVGLGLDCTRKTMSLGRRGYPTYRNRLIELLNGVENLSTKLGILQSTNKNRQIMAGLVQMGKDVLALPFEPIDTYLARYKSYIDNKVAFNKLGVDPNAELRTVHNQVRRKHTEFWAWKSARDERTQDGQTSRNDSEELSQVPAAV